MDSQTADTLLALNRRFYRTWAESFHRSRSHPWRGWTRLLQHLPPEQRLTVLDVGCGNGRLALFLRDAGLAFEYLGLDESEELLRHAREQIPTDRRRQPDFQFQRFELFHDQDLSARVGRRFHFIGLFGVLHHLPGESRRLELLRELSSLLLPGGLLSASAWRADQTEGFDRKVIPWDEWAAADRSGLGRALDPTQLEPGDTLLGWQGHRHVPRYCHFPEDAEILRWLQNLDLPLVDRYESDGRNGTDNLYLLWRRGS